MAGERVRHRACFHERHKNGKIMFALAVFRRFSPMALRFSMTAIGGDGVGQTNLVEMALDKRTDKKPNRKVYPDANCAFPLLWLRGRWF